MIQLEKDGEDMTKVVDLFPMVWHALPGLFAVDFVVTREWHPPSHLSYSQVVANLLPRGIRQLCKIQHHPNSERGTLANPLRSRPSSLARCSRNIDLY